MSQIQKSNGQVFIETIKEAYRLSEGPGAGPLPTGISQAESESFDTNFAAFVAFLEGGEGEFGKEDRLSTVMTAMSVMIAADPDFGRQLIAGAFGVTRTASEAYATVLGAAVTAEHATV